MAAEKRAYNAVCVECGAQGPGAAFVEYSPGNIKLKRCEDCGQVVDKYVEFEDLLVGVDVLLHKTSAHRHVIFNRAAPPVSSKATKALYATTWPVIWAFCFNSMIEFYIRMYYIGDEVNPAVLVSALCAGAGFNLLAIAIGVAAARLCQQRQNFDPGALARALSLGSAPKALFVVMSIWTYPRAFVLVLRALTASCTAVSLHAAMRTVSRATALFIALVVCAAQSAGGGIALLDSYVEAEG
ncbi:Protein arv1-like [Hondaea fermentalgiana]|uniref:Protein ARV n=1 Tax=Hondaea fermentalgiana TaxID=2315210 RepID=A0A2R5G7D7_9STRA|nr:Protein arv1-like [Hondaea fermentalgiana]|eukprot:GBG26957.1 Protein arv1-like [Hondaea fermentalgiana]